MDVQSIGTSLSRLKSTIEAEKIKLETAKNQVQRQRHDLASYDLRPTTNNTEKKQPWHVRFWRRIQAKSLKPQRRLMLKSVIDESFRATIKKAANREKHRLLRIYEPILRVCQIEYRLKSHLLRDLRQAVSRNKPSRF